MLQRMKNADPNNNTNVADYKECSSKNARIIFAA
jgi:hypothetical protein